MKKKHLTAETFETIMDRAFELADAPVVELDIEFEPIDLDAPVHASAAKVSSRPYRPGSTKVTIRIPSWVVDTYKGRSEHNGIPYQRLINRVLRADARVRDATSALPTPMGMGV